MRLQPGRVKRNAAAGKTPRRNGATVRLTLQQGRAATWPPAFPAPGRIDGSKTWRLPRYVAPGERRQADCCRGRRVERRHPECAFVGDVGRAPRDQRFEQEAREP